MSNINYVDSSFIIFAAALVMLMTPGLALFYGGLVRRKNVLSTAMHSYLSIAVISIQWIIIGYTLSFGGDIGGIIGNLKYAFLNNVGFAPNVDYAPNLPHQLFMLFQLKFAIITPALISGAFAERMRFPAFLLFLVVWATLVYDPIAHWVWGTGGFIRSLGALDFAGGNVVHISSGISALVVALMLGKRKEIHLAGPHHLPMTILGAGLLWFGWFGFNAGSALGVNEIAVNAFLTTNTAAAAGALAWMSCEWVRNKKPSVLGLVSGAVSGLVSITPAAGYVSVMSSIIIGVIGGAICFYTVNILKKKLGYDDALDAFGCHGIGGTWGGVATGIFASKAINPAGADGLIFGSFKLIGAQFISIVVVWVFAAAATFVILKVINLITPIRASHEEELEGLDMSLHGEHAYSEFEVVDKSCEGESANIISAAS
jgi:Amt family ammonium transporter